MNIHFKKRRKQFFNNNKAVRIAISLNNINAKETTEENNWEHNWIEQINEMSSGSTPVNQTVSKQNKLIIKWWEN